MKKITSICLCLLLMLSVTVVVYAAGSASMSLSTSGGTVYPGDVVTITVKLNNNQGVSNGGIVLSFDKNIFAFESAECLVNNRAYEELSAACCTFWPLSSCGMQRIMPLPRPSPAMPLLSGAWKAAALPTA